MRIQTRKGACRHFQQVSIMISLFNTVLMSKLRRPGEDEQDQQVNRWRHSTLVIQYLMSYLAFVILMGLADSNWGAPGQ